MAFAKTATLGICMWATALVVAASGSAQSQTCADGSSLWSVGSAAHNAAAHNSDDVAASIEASVDDAVANVVTTPVVLVAPAPVAQEDVQWCVDSNDPRCLPDPVGAPSAHLQHAGDVGQAARDVAISPPPVQRLGRDEFHSMRAAHGYRDDLERPPQRD